MKERLRCVLEDLLTPIRARRAEFASDRGELLRILKEGTDRARDVVAKTLVEVRTAMGINYFG